MTLHEIGVYARMTTSEVFFLELKSGVWSLPFQEDQIDAHATLPRHPEVVCSMKAVRSSAALT